jgi:hypothetical protein
MEEVSCPNLKILKLLRTEYFKREKKKASIQHEAEEDKLRYPISDDLIRA